MSVLWIEAPVKTEKKPCTITNNELLACRGCLSTKVALHDIHSKGYAQLFSELTGVLVLRNDGHPQFVCEVCICYLCKFNNFRMRCHAAMYMLQQLRSQNQLVTTDTISSIDKSHLKPNLTLEHVVIIEYPEHEEVIDNVLAKNESSSTNILDSDMVMVSPEECTVEVSSTAKRKTRRKRDKSPSVTKEKNLEVLEKNEVNEGKDTEILGKNKNIKEKTHFNTRNETSTIEQYEFLEDNIFENDSMDKQKVFFKDPVVVLPKLEDEKELEDIEAELKEVNVIIAHRSRLKTKPTLERLIAEKERTVKDINSGKLHKVKNTTEEMDELNDRRLNLYMRRAEKYSKSYNVEVIFLTKAQQLQEIEDRKNKSTKSTFRCHLCHMWFMLELTYQRHMACHDPTKPVECEICKYRFSSNPQYYTHYNMRHVVKLICKDCGIVNRKWEKAKRHSAFHRGAKIACEFCDKTFAEDKLYMMHLRAKHGPGPQAARCPLCEDVLRGRGGVQAHLNRAHKGNKRCKVCSTVFADDTVLQKHLDNSVDNECDPSKSPCSFCGIIFDSESMMQQHYEALHKKEFKCTQCQKSFAGSQQLIGHMRSHVLNRKGKRPHCATSGDDKRKPARGAKRSGGAKTSGGAKRKTSGGAKRSKKKVIEMFMCETCGKGNFTCAAKLRYHQRRHTGEKPYSCPDCDKAFITKGALDVHRTTHTDERKYKCPLCAKAFHQHSHRKNHLRTHTKERPYACYLCPKRYAGSGSLRDHINVAHKGLPPYERKKRNSPKKED